MTFGKGFEEKNRRILIITSTSFTYGYGANTNFITHFAVGLFKNNHFVEILVQKEKKKVNGIFEGVVYKACGKVDHKLLGLVTLLSAIFIPPFYILRNRKRLDCIITFENNFIESALITVICKIIRKPNIHIQVDFYDWLTYKSARGNGIRSRLNYVNNSLKNRFLNRFADGAIVLSTFLVDHFKKLGISEKKICMQPHLVNPLNFIEVRNTPIFISNTVVFGALGSINHDNGISDLLIAFKEVSDKIQNVELMLIGGSESDYQYCRDFVKGHGINGKIHYPGRFHYSMLAEILKKCDSFVIPRPASLSAIAGFPTKIGDFCSCKRPLICTNYGDIPLYFKDGYNALLANPSDPASLASKMVFVAENREKAKEIAERGYEWVMSNIEYISGTKKISSFINDMINKKIS